MWGTVDSSVRREKTTTKLTTQGCVIFIKETGNGYGIGRHSTAQFGTAT